MGSCSVCNGADRNLVPCSRRAKAFFVAYSQSPAWITAVNRVERSLDPFNVAITSKFHGAWKPGGFSAIFPLTTLSLERDLCFNWKYWRDYNQCGDKNEPLEHNRSLLICLLKIFSYREPQKI